jgi:hypothetical protein
MPNRVSRSWLRRWRLRDLPKNEVLGMAYLDDVLVWRIASRCGDCHRLFDEIAGDYCYMRSHPARLICLDCKIAEKREGIDL